MIKREQVRSVLLNRQLMVKQLFSYFCSTEKNCNFWTRQWLVMKIDLRIPKPKKIVTRFTIFQHLKQLLKKTFKWNSLLYIMERGINVITQCCGKWLVWMAHWNQKNILDEEDKNQLFYNITMLILRLYIQHGKWWRKWNIMFTIYVTFYNTHIHRLSFVSLHKTLFV